MIVFTVSTSDLISGNSGEKFFKEDEVLELNPDWNNGGYGVVVRIEVCGVSLQSTLGPGPIPGGRPPFLQDNNLK